MYSEEILERFESPRNAGNLRGANARGDAGSIEQGDVVRLFFRVENNIIEEAKFKAFGCVVATVAMDILCDMLVGKTLDNASTIKSGDVARLMGESVGHKAVCLALAVEAVHATIKDYKKRQARLGSQNRR